jgi:hypothetical protein
MKELENLRFTILFILETFIFHPQMKRKWSFGTASPISKSLEVRKAIKLKPRL